MNPIPTTIPIASQAPPAAPPPSRPGRGRRRGVVVGLSVAAAAVALGLGLSPAFLRAIDAYSLREAEAAYGQNRFPAALGLAQDRLRRHPSSRAAARLAALCLSRLGRVDEAEELYPRAGDLSADDRHVRAIALVLANRREPAIRAYDEILAIDPQDLLAMQRKAAVLISQSRWWDIEMLAGRVKAHPRGTVIGATLEGLAHLRQGSYEAAVTAFESVLRIDPGLRHMPLKPPSDFWANFAEALLNMGRAAEVRKHLAGPLAREDNATLAGLMARACQQQGDLEEAEAWLKLTSQWDPALPGPWLERGRLALLRGRPEEAIGLLRHAAELRPLSPDPLYSLSQAYRRLGQIEEADRLGARAKALRAPSPPAAGPGPPPRS